MEIEPEKIAQMIRIYDGLKRSSINFSRASEGIKLTEGEVYMMYLDMYRKHIPSEIRAYLNEEHFNNLEKECLNLGVNFSPFD